MPLDDLPVGNDPDPLEGQDLDSLRFEVLRLRSAFLASKGRIEVLLDRIENLEQCERELDEVIQHLQAELSRHPLMRITEAVRRRIRDMP